MRASSGASDAPDASTWLDGLLDGARQTTRSCAKNREPPRVQDRVLGPRGSSSMVCTAWGCEEGSARARWSLDSRRRSARWRIDSRETRESTRERRWRRRFRRRPRADGRGSCSDGGPGRAFAETDHAALEEDLEEIRELFLAGGDGVPAPEVTAATRAAEAVARRRVARIRRGEDATSRRRQTRRRGRRSARGAWRRPREAAGACGRAGRKRWFRRGDAASGPVPPRRQSRVEISQGEHRLPKGDEGTVMSYANASVAKYFGRG